MISVSLPVTFLFPFIYHYNNISFSIEINRNGNPIIGKLFWHYAYI